MPAVNEYKCRNCGASLSLSAAENGVLHCEYCHSSFTVPKKETSPAALDFIRTGEHELDTCSFDRAYAAYQKAAESDPTEPEAYFGMALSEFKVQYLHDGAHNCLQPICHEVSDKVFTRNKNYRRAIELATPEQRAQYEHKGQDINTVRDEFLSLQEDGIDYDSFICVKVTDDNTKGKTADYYIANELYTNLKEKGYKPFYSEPILKGKTGSAYEAHILYALNKAECMLIVCSDEEYLKTPWVKSEYTRFGELLRAEEKERDSVTFVYNARPIERFPDGGKRIQGIDYTRNDAYSKIYDFVESHTPAAKQRKAEADRKKKAEEEARQRQLDEKLAEVKRQQEETARELEQKLKNAAGNGAAQGVTTQSLLKRAILFSEGRDYDSATEYYNKVLDIDPECGDAWWGLMLSKAKCSDKDTYLSRLQSSRQVADAKNNPEFMNVKRYAMGVLHGKITDFEKSLADLYDKLLAEERARDKREERERNEAQVRMEKERREAKERSERIERERLERQRKWAEEQEEAARQREEEEKRQARLRADNEEILRRRRQKQFKIFVAFFVAYLVSAVGSAVFSLLPLFFVQLVFSCVCVGCAAVMTVFSLYTAAEDWLFRTFLISAFCFGALWVACALFGWTIASSFLPLCMFALCTAMSVVLGVRTLAEDVLYKSFLGCSVVLALFLGCCAFSDAVPAVIRWTSLFVFVAFITLMTVFGIRELERGLYIFFLVFSVLSEVGNALCMWLNAGQTVRLAFPILVSAFLALLITCSVIEEQTAVLVASSVLCAINSVITIVMYAFFAARGAVTDGVRYAYISVVALPVAAFVVWGIAKVLQKIRG